MLRDPPRKQETSLVPVITDVVQLLPALKLPVYYRTENQEQNVSRGPVPECGAFGVAAPPRPTFFSLIIRCP